jgi:hypothetical protein
MSVTPNKQQNNPFPPYRKSTYITGAILIGLGLMILLSQFLQTTWVTLILIPALGIVLLVIGVHLKRFGLSISGSLISTLGLGIIIVLNEVTPISLAQRFGILLISLGSGWLLITLVSVFILHHIAWWALVPAGTISSGGLCLFFTQLRIFDFVLFLGLGIGMSLLVWGIFDHLLGLIIPGCIVSTVGLGVFVAWQGSDEVNGLAQTGIMLVWFAIGWGLITLFSRALSQKFIWWPLIPGGVMAMVGWGLYIGGNPDNAVSFISNTGSVAIIIFGIYLLLIRRGIQQ